MIIISIKDLEKKTNNLQGKLIIDFDNKSYKKIKLISKKYKKQIHEITEEYSSNNLEIILVEHNNFYSIWLEQEVINEVEAELSQKHQLQYPHKMIKKYRGQVYEEEVLDSVTLKRNKINTKRLKYRGNYID